MLALTSVVFLQVRDINQLFLAIIFNAVASGLYIPSWKSVYTQTMKKKEATRDWSWFDGGNMLVTSAGAAVGGTLIGFYGFRGALMTMLALQLFGAIIALRLLLINHR